MIEHAFTSTIKKLLAKCFRGKAEVLFERSELLQYLNQKTKSASRGSKSRGSFASLYAIYVLVEDYISQGFPDGGDYKAYEGAKFSDLSRRQRELPFGSKLQNHALNHRMNQEFRKFFPVCEYQPILRDAETNRYWFNENLLNIRLENDTFNLAIAVIQIIDAYVDAKRDAFEGFISACEGMRNLEKDDPGAVQDFITSLLEPNVDARIFEIVSFSILKQYYSSQAIFWGWTADDVHEEFLVLYKTGRCNANDGGIDFVMQPLGRFFQVTETTDVRKYFLDIDKVQRYPITFVVKSTDTVAALLNRIREQAERVYSVEMVVQRYMECIQEIINIPALGERLQELGSEQLLRPVIDEVILQSKVEFNVES